MHNCFPQGTAGGGDHWTIRCCEVLRCRCSDLRPGPDRVPPLPCNMHMRLGLSVRALAAQRLRDERHAHAIADNTQRELSLVLSRLALQRLRADKRVTRVAHTVSEELAWHPPPIPVFARCPVRSTLHSN